MHRRLTTSFAFRTSIHLRPRAQHLPDQVPSSSNTRRSTRASSRGRVCYLFASHRLPCAGFTKHRALASAFHRRASSPASTNGYPQRRTIYEEISQSLVLVKRSYRQGCERERNILSDTRCTREESDRARRLSAKQLRYEAHGLRRYARTFSVSEREWGGLGW